MKTRIQISALLIAAASAITLTSAQDLPSQLPNHSSIINTRHNLTLRDASGTLFSSDWNYMVGMDWYRNNYAEVCVYCHTPHGANANVAAPLWNRNIPTTTYTTYSQLGTTSLTQTVYQPGAASLPCLSCHDGKQAVDAIINMPGSGRYSTTINEAFLDSWTPSSGRDAPSHMTLDGTLKDRVMWADGKPWPYKAYDSCLSCHSTDGELAGSGPDFKAAAIGTDLRDDHPVGVTFPAVNGAGTDWKTPNTSFTRAGFTTKFFDENGNAHLDKGEIRLYDSGNGALVECASCHDPHGVPSAGAGSKFNPTFLRKTNQNSAVCLTCHTK
jgi:hypothetical protein